MRIMLVYSIHLFGLTFDVITASRIISVTSHQSSSERIVGLEVGTGLLQMVITIDSLYEIRMPTSNNGNFEG